MIVITSAAYLHEVQADLGKLPPAFIPLGNQRLYKHQVGVIAHSFPEEDIYLSVPEDYPIKQSDLQNLKELGVRVLPVPVGLSLGESILYVINSIGRYDEVLRILHGDTLISSFPPDADILGLGEATDGYSWEIQVQRSAVDSVWCGYFSFSRISVLARSLTSCRGDFVAAVRQYNNAVPMATVAVESWYDLGHVNTYYKSRSCITTQRSFNNLQIVDGCLTKRSAQANKILAEASWFLNLPAALKKYTPQFISLNEQSDAPSYTIEYLHLPPLNELFVHGALTANFWRRVFELCNRCLVDFSRAAILTSHETANVSVEFRALIDEKTFVRLNEYTKGKAFSLDQPTGLNGRSLPSLRTIASACIEAASRLDSQAGVSHGDFCLSNILYDTRSDRIKLIDPRGLNLNGEFTIFGDAKYDIAKLAHSVLGLYDHIVAGLFTLTEHSPLHYDFSVEIDDVTRHVQMIFNEVKFLGKFCASDVYPIVILLFLSMLPLHEDNIKRQTAFLANALRLYCSWVDMILENPEYK